MKGGIRSGSTPAEQVTKYPHSTHNARAGSSLGDVGSGNEVRGLGKMGAHLKCAPAASAHSDSKKASKVSFAWKYDGDVDARLKQGHGCAVSNDVRRYTFFLKSGAAG